MRISKIAACAVLGAAAAGLPGCVVAVGTTSEASPNERMDRLEARVIAAEKALGIPAQEAAK